MHGLKGGGVLSWFVRLLRRQQPRLRCTGGLRFLLASVHRNLTAFFVQLSPTPLRCARLPSAALVSNAVASCTAHKFANSCRTSGAFAARAGLLSPDAVAADVTSFASRPPRARSPTAAHILPSEAFSGPGGVQIPPKQVRAFMGLCRALFSTPMMCILSIYPLSPPAVRNRWSEHGARLTQKRQPESQLHARVILLKPSAPLIPTLLTSVFVAAGAIPAHPASCLLCASILLRGLPGAGFFRRSLAQPLGKRSAREKKIQ